MTFDNVAEALSTFNILMALFPFLLSAFFFYAGYNYTPSERTYKQNVLRRAKQLLIPLAVAFGISTLLFFGMELAFHHADPMPTLQALGNSVLYGLLSDPLAIMIQFPQSGGIVFEFALALCLLWFLYALFICSLAFYALVKWTKPEVLYLHFRRRGLIDTRVLHRAIRRRLPPLYGAVLPRDRRDYAYGRISKTASLPRPRNPYQERHRPHGHQYACCRRNRRQRVPFLLLPIWLD